MPATPCLNKIVCACPELPLENLSSEDADTPVFCSTVTFIADPRLGDCAGELECTKLCCSEISQEDAYFCALRDAQECVYQNWTVTDCPIPTCDPDCPIGCPPFCPPTCPPYCPPHGGDGGPVTLYTNTAQFCTFHCPDGGTFTVVVEAGLLLALSQIEADYLAHAVACLKAVRERICFTTPAILPSSCAQTSIAPIQLIAYGGTPIVITFDRFLILPQECINEGIGLGSVIPYTWEIISGALPPGLRLGLCNGVISGTLVNSGDYSFTVKITDGIGSFATKTFHISIIDFADQSPLPDGTVNTAYSDTLALTGGVTPITWFIESGALPTGLTLNSSTGEISGTPTVAGTFDFTVEIKDSSP